MRARPMATLALAAVLAGMAVALTHAWLKANTASSRLERGGDVETTPVVVAARALRFGDRLEPGHLRVVPWPRNAVPEGVFHAVSAVLPTSDPRPRVVLRPIEAGEPLLDAKISAPGQSASLSARITPGMRAVTVPVGGRAGVAGFLEPGDRVDVLLTQTRTLSPGLEAGPASEILLQDMKVLGVGRRTDAGNAAAREGAVRSVTLEASAAAAQKLALAQSLGTLSLALRRPDSKESVSQEILTLGGMREALLGLPKPMPTKGAVLEAGVLASGAAGETAGVGHVVDAARSTASPGLTDITVIRGLEETEYKVFSETGSARRPMAAEGGR